MKHFFGLNVIIKPMRNVKKEYAISFSERFSYELFVDAIKFFTSTEIFCEKRS